MYRNLNPDPEAGKIRYRNRREPPVSILRKPQADPDPVAPPSKPAKIGGGILKPTPSKRCLACSVGTNFTATGKLLLHDCDHDHIDGEAYDDYLSQTTPEAASNKVEELTMGILFKKCLVKLLHPSPGLAYQRKKPTPPPRPASPVPSLASLDSFATADTSVDSDDEEDDLPFPEMFQVSAATSATSLSLMEDEVIEEEVAVEKGEPQPKKSVRFKGVDFETHVVTYDKWKENNWYREGGFAYHICDAFAEKHQTYTGLHERQLEAFHELLEYGHRLEEYKWADEDSRRLIQAFDCHPSKKSVPIKPNGLAKARKAWRAVASLPKTIIGPRVIDSMQGVDCSYSAIMTDRSDRKAEKQWRRDRKESWMRMYRQCTDVNYNR